MHGTRKPVRIVPGKNMEITIPNPSLTALIGPAGSGKSSFAKKHFQTTEIISSDHCRALVSDHENNQWATSEAFDLVHTIAGKRLKLRRLTAIDATSIDPESRNPLISLAKKFYIRPIAIAFNLPLNILLKRNQHRTGRNLPEEILRKQFSTFQKWLHHTKKEGFKDIYILDSERAVEETVLRFRRLRCDQTGLKGPFDIIGDVHGCTTELEELLEKLGYIVSAINREAPMEGPVYSHPEGRTAVFLGDIADRGPRITDAIRLVINMVKHGHALCVPGNHDRKLTRKLQGRKVNINHGLGNSLEQIEALPENRRQNFIAQTVRFFDNLTHHYVLDGWKLVVTHAGLKGEMQGRSAGRVREFCLYGDTTGKTDDLGLPVRNDWAAEYRGGPAVVYGHTPVPKARWRNNTINIDTGCVFGGKLTALRYPEMELTAVEAKKMYAPPLRTFR